MDDYNPVFSVENGLINGDVQEGIPLIDGWYFWDETWAGHHGPFATREEAQSALQTYSESL